MDTLKELKALRHLIQNNQAEAWNHNLSETSTCVILEDLTVLGDNDEGNTLTYNNWADRLDSIIQRLEHFKQQEL